MVNQRLKKTLLEIVENQLRENDPPSTGETFRQLKDKGYSDREAKEKIASVVLGDIYDILSDGKKFDEAAYNRKLKLLVEETGRKGQTTSGVKTDREEKKWENE